MSNKTIEQLFIAAKTLVIPGYQRDYAWTSKNIDDLFEDIEESMELGGTHYLGTFILSQKFPKDPVCVVDGQQRLTTLTLLLDALADAADEPGIRDYYRAVYIHHPVQGQRLTLLGNNQDFFEKLLQDKMPVPESDGQKRMLDAYQWIRARVAAIKAEKGSEAIVSWLSNISNLEVLEFMEEDQGKAIRMFQSVNDRGVPLTRMDIAKSLLIYYSNRFLAGAHDEMIAEKFGDAFRYFSKIKQLSSDAGYVIDLINRDSFKEDDILRYHYLAFDGSEHKLPFSQDYNATSQMVLEFFLKPALKSMRTDPERLSAFIKHYANSLREFFKALHDLVMKVREDRDLYLLFVVQGVSATLYPLVIRIYLAEILWNVLPGFGGRSILDLLGIVDLRVFKIQGTNPQADIATLLREFKQLTNKDLLNRLLGFSHKFMPDSRFLARIAEEDMYRNPGALRILLQADEADRLALNLEPLSIEELVLMVAKKITVEHIIPQEPSFGIEQYGFGNADDYEEHIHLLGNLAALENGINSACSNISVEAKMREPKLYRSSIFQQVRRLAADHAGQSPAFSKDEIVMRSRALAEFAVRYWSIRLD